MLYFLIVVLVGLMAMVVISLFRGLNAFRQSLETDAAHDPANGPSPLQIKQNQMMWARIKYQMAAIIVVALVLMMAR